MTGIGDGLRSVEMSGCGLAPHIQAFATRFFTIQIFCTRAPSPKHTKPGGYFAVLDLRPALLNIVFMHCVACWKKQSKRVEGVCILVVQRLIGQMPDCLGLLAAALWWHSKFRNSAAVKTCLFLPLSQQFLACHNQLWRAGGEQLTKSGRQKLGEKYMVRDMQY